MITPTLVRARSLDEPCTRMPHVGIGEGAVELLIHTADIPGGLG